MTSPVIGITVHVGQLPRNDGTSEWMFLLGARYTQAITAAGGIPVLLPTLGIGSADPEAVLDSIDALLLSGGGSIPGQVPATNRPVPTLRDVNPERYDFESGLVTAAWTRRIPLLGICRGHQTIAESLGGTILDLKAASGHRNHRQTAVPTEATHPIELEPSSLMAGWLGTTSDVNSFHRQVVGEPPTGWKATARSDDGWLEAIESTDPERFGVGTQFHPEWLAQARPEFKKIFDSFVAAGRHYRLRRQQSREMNV